MVNGCERHQMDALQFIWLMHLQQKMGYRLGSIG